MNSELPLVVFSHLRWDFVYQRPQHLLSRLAAHYRVIVIEEPLHDAAREPHWERSEAAPQVTVYRPQTPMAAPGFSDEQLPVLRALIEQLRVREKLQQPIVWLYTPLALPLAQQLAPRVLVYDCMDELSMFLNAPRQLLQREAELLQCADVVFTGGPSLYRAKLGRHANLHCFPSSVDAAHFRQAADAMREPDDQAALPHPRLGFYGVIDERMDLPLLDALARAHPEWQIVLIGPVVKIDSASLPRHANLHYLGQRRYEQLPAYLAGWDVCLLPFARNDATRFISPTKTLEYMAAEKMIVSTPITDVAEPYGDIVYLGDTPEAFVRACEQALNADEAERARRIAQMQQVLARTSWDRTAQAMRQLIETALHTPLVLSAQAVAS